MDKLKALGGVSGVASAICSHEHNGLDPTAKAGSPESVQEHIRVFGPNKYKEVPSKNFFALCWENIQDPIILLLIAAALVRAVVAVLHASEASIRACRRAVLLYTHAARTSIGHLQASLGSCANFSCHVCTRTMMEVQCACTP